MEAYEKFRNRGVVFISLTPDPPEQIASVKKFVEQYGIDWPTGYGAQKTLLGFQAEYYPAVWVIDRKGKVAWNKAEGGKLEDAIAKTLASSE